MIHVMHVLTGLGRGGAERVIADIVARTDPSRFRHSLCYLGPPHDLADEIRAAGCDVVCLNASGKLSWAKAAPALRAQIRERRPDVLHTATFEANLCARLASARMGVPQVTWLVGMDYDPESVRAAGWSMRSNHLRRWLDSWSAKAAGDQFVACSAAVMHSAIDRMKIAPSRIRVIYNPVDPQTTQADPEEVEALRRSLGLAPDAFVYLTVGRHDPPKAHGCLLEAFAVVAQDRQEARLVLLGRGPLTEDLRRHAQRLGVAERVVFLPSLPRIGPLLTLADVFCFPSLLEGLPVALLEAMTAGLSCIASDIPPNTEVIEHGKTGILVPRGSAEGLAAAMKMIRTDARLRERLGAAARAQCGVAFSADVVMPQWERLYEQLA